MSQPNDTSALPVRQREREGFPPEPDGLQWGRQFARRETRLWQLAREETSPPSPPLQAGFPRLGDWRPGDCHCPLGVADWRPHHQNIAPLSGVWGNRAAVEAKIFPQS